jgi:ligand-binding sensor domain-containing protein
MSMVVSTQLPHAQRTQVRAHLRTLRMSLTQARDALMHFKEDRVDRDMLEPAARRVDDLMDLFVGHSRDSTKGSLWLAEIQSGVERVTNPKATAALGEAKVDISALISLMGPAASGHLAVVPSGGSG